MNKKAKGKYGEDVACKYIVSHGFCLEDRNYSKKWGELDIVASKDNELHFFEVKSVTFNVMDNKSCHRPEDNVHGFKINRIRRMIESYLYDKYGESEKVFHFHVLCVYMNMRKRTCKVKWISDIIP